MSATIATPRLFATTVEPFRSTEQAWFWTMSALVARRERSNRGRPGVPRPCEPDDVVKCLDQLYRGRRIELLHAAVLRIWGERGAAPDPSWPGDRCDWRLWDEAMQALAPLLRAKGIVV